jgi:hypothetical protein
MESATEYVCTEATTVTDHQSRVAESLAAVLCFTEDAVPADTSDYRFCLH